MKSVGRIITFYSYKGGTGRSMALANVAWILASHGLRVLAIDWDLEAPGLHRYFHPFLEDKELENSPGLIDYVVEFTEAARHAEREAPTETTGSTTDKWYERYTSLLRYTYSLDWDFGDGTLDFVPAGQQSSCYSVRVNGFDWQEFYEKLGGGILLEALKKRLREDYDYVLIDSRTGISDTSGICTVQMPDDLVVCFTLNQQSIKGAAAVAASALSQRRLTTGQPSVRIWPVPTRVELAEKDRLEAAREMARTTFQDFVKRLERDDRDAYWKGIEILYQPYYAYEEVLAVFADKRRQRSSMLASFENLTGWISEPKIDDLARMSERDRQQGLERFQRMPKSAADRPRPGTVFISAPSDDIKLVDPIVTALQARLGDAVWWDTVRIRPGDDWREAIDTAASQAKVVLAFFGPNWALRPSPRTFEKQVGDLLRSATPIIPVLVGNLRVSQWADSAERLDLEDITQRQAIRFSRDVDAAVDELLTAVRQFLASGPTDSASDPEDPQKGKWGGKASDNDRTLSADVRAVTDDWFKITLQVVGTSKKPLMDRVEFHLHPTFSKSIVVVDVVDGRATLELGGYGAFTVGATADEGRTRLELDLSENQSFPKTFRLR